MFCDYVEAITGPGGSVTKTDKGKEPDKWHVLVVGLPLAETAFDLGESVTLQRLAKPLTVFDLAAVGAAGFRQWAVLEPLVHGATAEFISAAEDAHSDGYDALNKCWLASALLVLRGFARHTCPAVAGYSWNFIAGHQAGRSETFKQQVRDQGVQDAVFHPADSFPEFQGGLLDYHLDLFLPKETRDDLLTGEEAGWIREHFTRFNLLAAESSSFRFGLEAAIDWRYAKDPRAAISRIWAGIESLFGIKQELVYRISLHSAAALATRGSERLQKFAKVKKLYGLRSKAVHGGDVTPDQLMTATYESYELLRHLLLDAIANGGVRSSEDWLESLLCN